MKPQHVHREVLIFTNTTLSQKALCRNNNSNNNKSALEELEEACWDGLLNELLPEMMPSTGKLKLVIWAVYAGEHYLLIDLADSPGDREPIFTIDPAIILSLKNMN